MDDDELRQDARRLWASDNLEIDPDAAISHAEYGAWVAAWVWVARNDEQPTSNKGA